MTTDNSSPTRVVADYIEQTAYEAVPEEVIRKLRYHLLDAVASAAYGAGVEWTSKITNVLRSWGGEGQATVWFSQLSLPVPNAAFANTVATHAFELDDRRVASYMHPASATLPAALAISETLGEVSGRDLLTAIVTGYEVGLRVGKCVGRGSHTRGFYAPGLGGAFAAAATAAKLRGLTNGEILAALNLAATQASGLYSPTEIKRFNIGRGTHNGMVAVELARAGFTGIDNVFEAAFGGFCEAYAGEVDFSLLTDGLGDDYETAKVELKPYVSSRPNHTSIDCILELRTLHPEIDESSVEAIEIEVSVANYQFGADFEVRNVANALMSVAYCVAVAFIDGDAFLPQFTEQRVTSRDVADLMHRTTVIPNGEFDQQGIEYRDRTRVRCRLADGRVFKAERSFARGHPSDPLSESEVVEKARRLAGDRLGDERFNQLLELVLELDRAPNTRALVAALAAPAEWLEGAAAAS